MPPLSYMVTAVVLAVLVAVSFPLTMGFSIVFWYWLFAAAACILAILGQPAEAFAWLERSVATGFACWPFFLNDPALLDLRALPEFQVLISSLQSKYPDHLGLL